MREDGLIEAMTSEISLDRILDSIRWITRYHRMQATGDMLRAAEYVAEKLSEYGLKAEVLRYPMSEWLGGMNGLVGWECRSGVLELLEPERYKLADWEDSPFYLVQRSAPIDGVFEVVEYDPNGDMSGKFVLTDDLSLMKKLHQLMDKNIAGIIFYGIGEHSLELPDAKRYLSFWWVPGSKRKLSGFVLSYRQGLRLRRMLCRGKTVKVRAKIESEFYEGTLDIVTGVIKGESPDEIVLSAHLCHPKGEANDNASGSAVVMEIARVYSLLIKKGTLKKPKRTIRFLLVPEIYGTNAFYLNNPEYARRGVMGLNFDMVGSDIALSRGSMTLDHQPVVTPGYASSLANRLRHRFVRSVPGWNKSAHLNVVPMSKTPFSDGTDHLVLSDPTFGIPAPTLINWPDIFYHTDHDTVDKLSADSLRTAASTGLVFAFMAVNPSPEHLRCAADSVLLDTIDDVQQLLKGELDRLDKDESSASRFMAMIKRLGQRAHDDLATVAAEGFDVSAHEAFISRYLTDLIQIYEKRFNSDKKFFDNSLYPNDKTPFRKVIGLYWPWNWLREHRPDIMDEWLKLSEAASEDNQFAPVPDFAYLWIDGNRDTREIAFDIAAVYGKPIHPEQFQLYLKILADLDLIDFK